jgi:hypothetical protein
MQIKINYIENNLINNSILQKNKGTKYFSKAEVLTSLTSGGRSVGTVRS